MQGAVTLAVLALVHSGNCGREKAMADTLEFRIEVEPGEFKAGQPVPGRMTLKNVSGAPVRVNQRLLVNFHKSPHEVYFDVTDEKGEKAPFSLLVNAGQPKESDFAELAPGEAVSRAIDLGRAYLTRPGLFTVKAVYENTHGREGAAVWQGRLESNTLSVRVQP